ncbi:formate hydrogenlyase subunit 3/multisubunit Na+/H+ antiporter MnhD subunit [Halomonas campaniensis]|uniref:Formate hydrogenlyase subunit 3/multisubunit Na+/H+ antiporter MnhD subunit n=1 Tax=Halomonas campaniensis TaxID=213554 RepID=A0A7W5K3L9_9GAMM|nr:proton-conducting transporter membrane subunit [Halomonas campaniensis]MBB3331286.1 formate hydrogenlyase subunit 3/multisubunit Na+/H+ antiporter MnhD subunit [Halomonas campaniensis]
MSAPLASPPATEAALLWLVLLVPPLLGLLAWRFPPRRMLPVLLAGLPLPLATLWLLPRVAGGAVLEGSWAPGGLQLHWRLDGLAGLLLLLTQLLLLASAAYAVGHRRATELAERAFAGFWPLLGGLAAALGVIWVAADLLTLYAALELMGLTAVGMMLLPGKPEALAAGLRYLLYALVGSLAWLLGVALLLGATGRLDLAGLAADAEAGPVTGIAMALLAAGLLLKAAVFPLHGWLAPVHASAWTQVSALHGALVVKASFFILMQLWQRLVPEAQAAAWLLGALGSLAVLWGGLQAWRASRLKQVVAWSTVGQLGYLMLAFPLLAGTSAAVASLAWQATWLQLAGHALAKAAMFMAAGNLVLSVGQSRLADLAGTSRQLPLSLMTFGLAAVTLMGLPPSAGFTAKWLLLQAAILAGQWPWVIVLVAGTLLTAAYVFRVFRCAFVEEAPRHDFRPLPAGMDLIALLLALAALALGLGAEWPLALLREGGLP